MQRETQLWDYVVDMYKEKLNIPKDIVELLSVLDILQKCIEGLSNEIISRYLDLDLRFIKTTLEKYFSFDGWSNSLDFSPIQVYNRVSNLEEFIFEVEMIAALVLPLDVNLSYEVCKKYKELENSLEKYGY